MIESGWSSDDKGTDDVPAQEFHYVEDEPKLFIHNTNQTEVILIISRDSKQGCIAQSLDIFRAAIVWAYY